MEGHLRSSLPGAAAVGAVLWGWVTLGPHSMSDVLQPSGRSGDDNPSFEGLLPAIAQGGLRTWKTLEASEDRP